VVDFLLQVVLETWNILREASVFLLFGFLVAGMIAVLLPGKTLMCFFGTGKVKSVLWAASLGVPLPLCSCGVLPTALGLRRQGATKGATVAFLISTPETGIDSIAVSYALMDPVITFFRPFAALVTAIFAGLATNWWGEPKPKTTAIEEGETVPAEAAPAALAHDPHDPHDHGPGHDHEHHSYVPDDLAAAPPPPKGATAVGREVMRYAFLELFDETSYWLMLGFILSGVVGAVLPPTVFEGFLSGEFTSMLAMLVIGIPIYTCASASTPIAAALVLKGLNPGAALVFLLAGPATNIGSLTVLLKFLGARVVAIYLASIIVFTLLAGLALNWIYRYWDMDPLATFGTATEFIPESIKIASAVLLLALLFLSMARTHIPVEWLGLRDRFAGLSGARITGRGLGAAVAALAVFYYVTSGFFTVQPGEVGVKSRFGRIVAPDLGPGYHVRAPWPFESHRVVPRDIIRRVEFGFRTTTAKALAPRALARASLTIGGPSNAMPRSIKSTGFLFQKSKVAEESFLLTGDGNLIDVSFTVHFRVEDAIAYAFNLAEPEQLVRSLTLAALREIVGTSKVDALFTTERGAVEGRVIDTVQGQLDAYRAGVELISVRLLYVHPPEEIHNAFRDVASAQEDKIHIINRAGTFAVEKVNLAQGDAAALVEEALAFREEKILHAEGDAAAFGFQVDEYNRAPELTRFRLHLETAEEVLPRAKKILRPGADDVGELDLWLFEPFARVKER
jgi:HflK protein